MPRRVPVPAQYEVKVGASVHGQAIMAVPLPEDLDLWIVPNINPDAETRTSEEDRSSSLSEPSLSR